MIISHRHRFIFAAIPKTGTHSVRQALREQLGPDDQEQVGLFFQSKLPFGELSALGHGHITLSQVRPHVGEETFTGYFKFAFVRNPYDRFVSYCAFMTRKTGDFERNPRAFMRRVIRQPPHQHILFAPQHIFLTDKVGGLLADGIGRVEEMQASYDGFCGRLGFPTKQLERVNNSRRDDYRSYYDRSMAEEVARLYRRDIDLFGYEF